jgi:hypothetical protein
MTIAELQAKRESAQQDVKALKGQYDELAGQQEKLVGEAGGHAGLVEGKLTEFQNRNKDLAIKHDQMTAAKSSLATFDRQIEDFEAATATGNPLNAGSSRDQRRGARSFGDILTQSEAYKAITANGRFDTQKVSNNGGFSIVDQNGFDFRSLGNGGFNMQAANDLSTSTVATWPTLLPGITPAALWPPRFSDFLPKLDSSTGVVKYRVETTHTDAAAARAEASPLVQSDFATVPVTDNASVIGTYYRITEEEFADAPYMRSYLDTQGLLRTQIAIENQLLTGNGAGGGLTGFYNRTVNSVPIGTYSPAGATDNNGNALTNVDIIAKGVNATRVNGVCDPSLVVIHTSDLLAIRLLKNSFGQYIYGNPSDLQDVRIWGVPIYETPRAVLGSPLTGDFTMHSSMVLFPNMPARRPVVRFSWSLVVFPPRPLLGTRPTQRCWPIFRQHSIRPSVLRARLWP